MNILVTRPEPDALTLKGLIEARGHPVLVEPLMRVALEPDAIEDLDGVAALIATSRNALKALRASSVLEQALELPLFAVGRATADEARRIGFHRVITGPGTAAGLAAAIGSVLDPADGLIVHLSGDTLAGDVIGDLDLLGFRAMRTIVYRMVAATSLRASTITAIAEGDVEGVVLMSPRTSQIWAGLLRKHELVRSARAIAHLCLSRAVAAPLASLGSIPIDVADAPTTADVLALIETVAARMDF